ncbi:hypothetical protein AAC387_Pa12g1164 [Persea americana]
MAAEGVIGGCVEQPWCNSGAVAGERGRRRVNKIKKGGRERGVADCKRRSRQWQGGRRGEGEEEGRKERRKGRKRKEEQRKQSGGAGRRRWAQA